MEVTLIQNSLSYNNNEGCFSLPFYLNYGILKSKNVRTLGMSAFETPALTLYSIYTLLPCSLLSVHLYASIKKENCK
jgi:hypothetical protein